MTQPSDYNYEAPLHPFGREGVQKNPQPTHAIGIELFERVFNFYAWYLSYDLNPSKHPLIFESLSLLMQIAKLSFEGAALLSSEEEKRILRELYELSDALSNGMLKNRDLLKSLEKILKRLVDNNPKAKLIAILMKLEYKICIHNEVSCSESFQVTFKEMLSNSLEKITSSLPNLIANTVARELETLYAAPLHVDTFLKEFKESTSLLKHAY